MYRRSSRKGTRWPKKTKYSNETYSCSAQIVAQPQATGFGTFTVVDALTALGARKFKNPTLTIGCEHGHDAAGNGSLPNPIFFALVYVPQGLTATGDSLSIGTQNSVSLYEPNQNVILQGMIMPGKTYTFSNRLGRNLDSRDQILLLIKQGVPNDQQVNINQYVFATINYAISF